MKMLLLVTLAACLCSGCISRNIPIVAHRGGKYNGSLPLCMKK